MTGERIRLAYFSNATARGGAEEHILTLLRGLDRARFQPFLVCTPEVALKLGTDVPSDVDVFPLTYKKLTHMSGAFRLTQFLRRNRIQILHSHLFNASLFASPVGRLSGVTVIMETPHLRERWRQGWLKGNFFVDRLAGRFVDSYIAVSEANGAYLRDVKKLPARKIHVIQNGSDVERFQPSHRVPVGMKSALGFAEDDPVVLVPARLEPQKGHAVLLNALPRVLREFPNLRAIFAGEGALRGELETQSRHMGLDSNVCFVGRQSNMDDWFALCYFTVLPSFFEGLPLVAVESLAAGKPMVATAVDGTPEVILDGKTGLTIPPGDPERLADAICQMLRDPAMRQSMATSGRAWVLERFTQKRQLDETQQLYFQALEQALVSHASISQKRFSAKRKASQSVAERRAP